MVASHARESKNLNVKERRGWRTLCEADILKHSAYLWPSSQAASMLPSIWEFSPIWSRCNCDGKSLDSSAVEWGSSWSVFSPMPLMINIASHASRQWNSPQELEEQTLAIIFFSKIRFNLQSFLLVKLNYSERIVFVVGSHHDCNHGSKIPLEFENVWTLVVIIQKSPVGVERSQRVSDLLTLNERFQFS